MSAPLTTSTPPIATLPAPSPREPSLPRVAGSAPRHRWGRLLFVVAMWLTVFFAGGICGVIGHAYWLHATLLGMKQYPEKMPTKIADMIAWDYGLSPEQKAEVFAIFTEHHSRMQGLRKEHAPTMQKWNDELEEKISHILKPADFQRFRDRFREVNLIWGGL
ncbi:MAG: hypothetical protein C0478_02325 [Planctomyces sp.]|nr:hypothetical protein [Planctomyces sp.]